MKEEIGTENRCSTSVLLSLTSFCIFQKKEYKEEEGNLYSFIRYIKRVNLSLEPVIIYTE